ncbi:MAG: C40 family peptidase [Spirochaetota bacterium]
MKKAAGILILLGLAATLQAGVQSTISKQEKTIRISLVMTANSCLGIGYLFNGTTPAGFDNPGFTQYVYYKSNIDLPRTVEEQYKAGKPVDPRNAKPGDLIFFYRDGDRKMIIDHVGIYLGKDKFMHMPGEGLRVAIDRITKGNTYAKRFAAVRSYRHIFTVPDDGKRETRPEKTKPQQSAPEEESNQMFETEDY